MRIMIASTESAVRQEIGALLDGAAGITTSEEQVNPQILDQIQDLEPDLILLDLDSGTYDSSDLVSSISQRHPAIKIVVLSAPGQEQRVLDALRNGAHGQLTKGGNDGEQLVASLRAVGRGDSILSPVMAGILLDDLSTRYQRFRRTRVAEADRDPSSGSASAQQKTE